MKSLKEETTEVALFLQLSCVDWGRALMQPLCTVTPVKLSVILQHYRQHTQHEYEGSTQGKENVSQV